MSNDRRVVSFHLSAVASVFSTLTRALLPAVNDPGTAIHVTTRALIKQRGIAKAGIRKLIQEKLRFPNGYLGMR